VVLTRPKGENDIPFTGRVIVTQANGENATFPLPPPYEPDDLFWLVANSVMFRAIELGGEKVLIVLYLSHKVGSREYNNLANVYRWTGAQFERVDSVEALLTGAKSAAAVEERLIRSRTKFSAND
jgi:hypothetical protein